MEVQQKSHEAGFTQHSAQGATPQPETSRNELLELNKVVPNHVDH
jgi:hypothetical protein